MPNFGLYANSILFLPEEGIVVTKQRDEEERQSLQEMVAEQLKRRRIQIPPASSEEQRVRIMEALARTQSYFGITIEEVIQRERSRFRPGTTVVVITPTMSDLLLDTLASVKRMGHTVTILFIGDASPPVKPPGVAVYPIGGEQTWQELEASYSNLSDMSTGFNQSEAGFHL